MPSYTYKCKDCNSILDFICKIDDDTNESIVCKSCGSKNMIRLFRPPSSKVRRSKEEIVENAKEEARNIARKIEEGNTGLIRDIYGDQKT